MRLGLGQCAAEMVVAYRFNRQHSQADFPIYGAISTGTNWRFLRLEGQHIFIDRTEYFVPQIDQILGILCEAFRSLAIDSTILP